jgi:hypothetical protein
MAPNFGLWGVVGWWPVGAVVVVVVVVGVGVSGA